MNYDLAVDIGTTNLCISLFSCKQKVFTATIRNSLYKYGTDIISRLTVYNGSPQLRSNFQSLLISDIQYLLASHGYELGSIGTCICCANTVMLYFLLGKDAGELGVYPFRSAISADDLERFKNVFVQKVCPVERVVIPPVIGGFVGADMFSVLYSIFKQEHNIPFAVIDLGTNAEIGTFDGTTVRVASVAAGPAFGALGSELIRNVADGLRDGSIDRNGSLLQKKQVSQQQLRSLQLAKAAVYTGLGALMDTGTTGVNGRLPLLYITGVFGGLIKQEDLEEISMIPPFFTRVEVLGNAALSGLEQMLLTSGTLDFSFLTSKLQFIELANTAEFADNYVLNMDF